MNLGFAIRRLLVKLVASTSGDFLPTMSMPFYAHPSVKYAEVTARGKDYVGSSKATTDVDGRFEIEVRPDSELELSAAADGLLYSDAQMVRTEGADLSLGRCLTVTARSGSSGFSDEN